jgi:hypothetical protein
VINLDVYNRIQSHVHRSKPQVTTIPGGSLDEAPVQLKIDEFTPETLEFPGEDQGKKKDDN